MASPFLLRKSGRETAGVLQPPPAPGPCILALACAATGGALTARAEGRNLVTSSPQQLNHAMCAEELAGKPLGGGSAPRLRGTLLWQAAPAGPGSLPRPEARAFYEGLAGISRGGSRTSRF